MSGAKKASARDSIAMRGPSRQITAVLIAGGVSPGRDGAGQIGDDQAFGAVGNAGERQRPAGLSRRAGDACNLVCAVTARPCRASWNALSWRSTAVS